MKKSLLGLALGAILVMLGVVSLASASSSRTEFRANGILCRAGGTGVVCIRSDAHGYGIGITRRVVVVTAESGRVLFHRPMPREHRP